MKNINQKLQLVIFDMDGLMIDTEPVSKEGWRLALSHYGYEMTDEFFSQLLGRSLITAQNLTKSYFGDDADFDAIYNKRCEYRDAHVEKYGISIKKGLLQILNIIDELGIKKCIATSTDRSGMDWKLKGLNLIERFDGFITGDMVKEVKPNPEIFIKAAQFFGTDPSACIVIEDSPSGVAAGYAAGMKVIMVPDMAKPGDADENHIYAICADLEEVAEVISRLA